MSCDVIFALLLLFLLRLITHTGFSKFIQPIFLFEFSLFILMPLHQIIALSLLGGG